MNTNFEEMIKGMTEFLKGEAKTETIIGKEFKLGEFSCVPVIAVGLGVGGGSGSGTAKEPKAGQGEGGAGAAGLGLGPIGFLVSRGDQINFISTKGQSGLNTAFEKLPDLLSKYFESRKKEKTTAAN